MTEHEAAFTTDHRPALDRRHARWGLPSGQRTYLTAGDGCWIVECYDLAYDLENLQLVAWQQDHGGFKRGPKA